MRLIIFAFVLFTVCGFGNQVFAAANTNAPTGNLTIPGISLQIGNANSPQELNTALKIVIILTVLTLVPSILIMLTSFTRIVVVLSFIRHALGTNQTPSNQLIIGLAIFLTFFVMGPVWQKIDDQALKPFLNNEIGYEEACSRTIAPIRTFMLAQTREKDLKLFVDIAAIAQPKGPEDLPLRVLIPGFIISELKTAFIIGFLIYLPFLIIDMIISSVLMSVGMMMLPPVMISLPFKLLIFVLADGWYLIVGSLVQSFRT